MTKYILQFLITIGCFYPITLQEAYDQAMPFEDYDKYIQLNPDSNTPSGIAWSSSKGPPFTVDSGTLANVAVTVGSEPPINYLAPIFPARRYSATASSPMRLTIPSSPRKCASCIWANEPALETFRPAASSRAIWASKRVATAKPAASSCGASSLFPLESRNVLCATPLMCCESKSAKRTALLLLTETMIYLQQSYPKIEFTQGAGLGFHRG